MEDIKKDSVALEKPTMLAIEDMSTGTIIMTREIIQGEYFVFKQLLQ